MFTQAIRAAIIAALVAFLPAAASSAQAPSVADSIAFVQQRCDSAAAALDASAEASTPDWGPAFLTGCGPSGRQVLARATRALRFSANRGRIREIYEFAALTGDTAVLSAAVAVAGDVGATPAARAHAIRAALMLSNPGLDIDVDRLLDGSAAAACEPVATSYPPDQGGLTTTARDQGFTAIRAVASDSSAPSAVRAAARCASRARPAP
ncbi:hypothetical protein [Roseisolibacter agri]|uniref:Uncharacterized protein n=1 Tax=Roseisolibacter agri TaxID=2014610 RepID=A0AA37Q8N4_9BACT|nr:hypothetical protein [Roseisolibacter agri]GLC28314.1 hypothetical protein rosag_48270 [Roseisolibacter agri]